jgi:hypothetical protein
VILQAGWYDTFNISECLTQILAIAERVRANDLTDPEARLSNQAVCLDAIFTMLVTKADTMHQNPEVRERLLRMAFKAQSQCSPTLERLALMKNPAGQSSRSRPTSPTVPSRSITRSTLMVRMSRARRATRSTVTLSNDH